MAEEPRVFHRMPTKDELALGYAWGEDEGGELFQLKGVSQEDRNAHFYIVGATRTGKTKLLEEMIEQDIRNGEGFGVIDPHGDLIEAVKERLALMSLDLDERVVLIDPTDAECSVCFNPLELPEGVKSAELAAELVEVFEKIWSKAWGDRMADIFRNTLIALIENNLTLDEVLLFLTDPAFRARLLPQVQNEKCREYFANEFNVLNPKTRSEWITSTSNKVRAFLSDERVRQIFLSPKSSFNFREIMDSGKIILVKLDKGRLKGASELLGALILSKIQMAAFSRTDIKKMSERKQFYLYIDEFQNFATDSFIETLAEAAKYKLSLILVHQNLAQLPPELRASLLGNCNLQAYFRVARHDAELLAKEAFAGVYGDAPRWEEYIQQLQTLPNRVCVVKKNAGGIVFIRIPDIIPPWQEAGMDESEFEAVVKKARIGELYVRRRDDIETEYRARMAALAARGEPENFRVKRAGEIPNYEEMIKGGENDEVEFKASLRWGYEQGGVSKPIEHIIAKAISSFMNAEGGTLFIGVKDDGKILGIENDYATVNHKNKDGFLLQLTQVINQYLGKEFHQYVSIKIARVGDKDICVVDVSKSKMPVFLKNAGKEDFYVRASASSQLMSVREANEYITTHFSKSLTY